MGDHSADSDWKGDLAKSVRREREQKARTSGSVVDLALDLAASAANALSVIAKSEGDLPTMYAANRAWRELFDAQVNLAKRRASLSNGDH